MGRTRSAPGRACTPRHHKANEEGHAWLADRVYSSVPAQEFGLEQKIEISPVSGSPT